MLLKVCALSCVWLCVGVSSGEEFTFFASIDGGQAVPPNASPAIGAMSGTYDDVANTFSFSWDISDNLIGTPGSPGAHIHAAPAGVNGGVVFGMTFGVWSLSGGATWTDLSDPNINDLFTGNLYVNFHTSVFGGGEVRGQIMQSVLECACDWDGNGSVDVTDLLEFLAEWFAQTGGAAPAGPGSGTDFDADDLVDVQDLLGFLSCWFPANGGAACP